MMIVHLRRGQAKQERGKKPLRKENARLWFIKRTLEVLIVVFLIL